MHIRFGPGTELVQAENRIADNLTGAMISHRSTPLDPIDRIAEPSKRTLVAPPVIFLGAPSDREDRSVLEENKRIGATVGDPFLNQLALELPRRLIVKAVVRQEGTGPRGARVRGLPAPKVIVKHTAALPVTPSQ